jgi:hypothetical protein
MGIKYDGMKLVWLKQYGSNQTLVSWVSPNEGDVGTFTGGYKPVIQHVARVINGRNPTYSLIAGALPTGLSLNANTGIVTGTLANVDGSFEYTLRATSGLVHADRTFTANVAANQAPVWVTNAGSLGADYDSTQVEIQLEAEDPENQPIKYSIVAGSLPLGLFLNQNTGVISGTLNPVTDDTTFFFTIAASDGVSSTQRAFSYQTLFASVPQWVSPAGLIGTQTELRNFTYTLQATGAHPITYSVVSGQLPPSLTLDANTGVINGTVDAVALDKIYNFTVSAFDGVKSKNQNQQIRVLKDRPPTWISSGQIGQGFGGAAFSTTVVAQDPNFMSVTYSMANGSSLPGDLTLSPSGFISGNLPEVEITTSYNFSIVASDGNLTAQRSFSINVLKNEAPIWDTGNALAFAIEEQFFSRQVSAHDPAGVQPITYKQVSGTIPAGTDFYANGVLRGTPISVSSDTDFVFVVEANNGVLASQREFTLQVQNNEPPVWSTNSGLINTVQGFTNYSYQLAATDQNGTSPVYTLQSGSLPPGLTLGMNGQITGIVANVVSTTQYDFDVSASDGYNSPVNRSFAIVVTPNLPPVWITNSGVLGSAFETAPLTVQVQATDPEGANIRYYLAENNNLPPGMFLNATTGVITGTIPHVEQDTTFTFNIFADDGTFANRSRTLRQFQITALFNSPPVWVTDANLGNAVEGLSYSKQLSATGVGNGPMIYTLESGSLPSGLTLTASGLISGILPAAAEDTEYTFEVKAFNGIKSTNRTFTFTVMHNLAPVWATNSGVIVSQLGNVNFNYQLSAPDPNNQTVTYTLTNATTLPFGVSMNPSGRISGIMNIVATDTQFDFDVRASDGVLGTDRSFSIIALAQAAPSWITPAGEIASVFKTTYYSGFVQATDPQGLPLTYSIISGALPNGLSLNPSTGLIAGITPNVSNDTTYNFTIRVSDGSKTADRAFSFVVTAVSAPVWTTPAGSLGSVLSGYSGSFSMTATDPQGIGLTYNFISGNIPPGMTFQGGSSCTVFNQPNTVVPVTSTDATYTFTVEVTNGFVAVQRTFSITVLKNLAPVWDSPAAGNLGNAIEGAPVSITFEAHDPEDVNVYYVLTSGSFPSGLSLNANTGALTGNAGAVPNTTVYNFTVEARDGVLSNARSFSFTTVFSSPPIWVTPSGLLGNGLEQTTFTANVVATSDGDTIEYTLANGTNLPSGLTLDANTGTITGMLPPVVSDTTYNFSISARSTRTNKSTDRAFSIGVVNDLPPVWSNAAGSFLSDLAGTAFTKIFQAVDPNGTPITYVLANGTLPGGVTFDPNGAGHTAVVSGVLPNVGSDTTYNFTLGASDGISQVNRSFSFTSQLDVEPVWTTNAGLIGSGTENASFNYVLVATDPNGKTITYSLDNGSTLPGTLTLNTANGRLFGVLPTANANTQVTDNYPFSVTASDGTLSNSRTFSINVNANLDPVWVTASGSIGSTVEGQTFSFQLQATDPEGQTLTYTLANSTQLPNGFTLYANGKVDGRAVSTQQDTTYNFTVRASDGVKFADRNFSLTVLFDTTNFDPLSNSVTLLLNFEDTVGSNAITDWFDHALTVTGNVVVSNAQVQYGNSAFYNQNVGEIVTNRLPDFDFMNKSNWTVEAWVYCLDNTTTSWLAAETPFNEGNTLNPYWAIKKAGSVWQYKYGNGDVSVSLGNVVVNQWQHIAVSRQGSTVRTFNNGVLISTTSQGTTASVNQNLEIGLSFQGYIDDFRVTDTTRYTSTFTPGPAPKPPKWLTAANAIVIDGTEGTTITNTNSIALEITDQSGRGVRNYNTISGAVSGVTLDIANGTFSGTIPQSVTGGLLTLNAQGKDGNNNLTSIRPFQFRSNALSAPSELRYSWRFNNQTGSTNYNPTVGNATMTLVQGGFNYHTGAAPHQDTQVANFAFSGSSATILANTGLTSGQMAFLAGDYWTWETWIHCPGAALESIGGNRRLVSISGTNSPLTGNAFNIFSSGTQLVVGWFNNVVAVFPPAPANQWNHLAVVRNGNTITAYTNGVAGTSSTVGTTVATVFNSSGIKINEFYDQGGFSFTQPFSLRGFNLWSTAKYTNNFVPQWDSFLTPIWTTNSGVLLTDYETANFAVNVSAKSFGNTAITYEANSSLPNGVTVLSNGYIYGTMPAFGSANAVSLVATDANGYKSPTRTFVLNSLNSAPVWISNGVLGSNVSNAVINLQLATTDPLGATPITYTLNSGTIPSGLTLLSNGLITGMLDVQTTDKTYTFTVNAVNTTGKYSISNTLTYNQYTDFDTKYANTYVLLHGDGNTTDNGNTSLTWSLGGQATTQNSVVKWGSGSFRLTGLANTWVRSNTITNTAKYGLNTRSFTAEFWVNLTGFRQIGSDWTGCVLWCGQPSTGNNHNAFGIFLGGTGATSNINSVSVSCWNSAGNGQLVNYSGAVDANLNTWHHVAAQREGNNWSLYFNGNLIATTVNSSSIAPNFSTSYVWNIGTLASTVGFEYPTMGYVDDVRVTYDVARYTGNSFVLPDKSFPNTGPIAPAFSNSAGLGSSIKQDTISKLVVATPRTANATPITYSLVSGSLPGTSTLLSNGLITGMTANVSEDTVNTFTIRATDAQTRTTDQEFIYNTYATGDALFNNVAVLIHAEDTANGTFLTDTRGLQTFTLTNAAPSTADKKFGSSSLYFTGANTTTVSQSAVNPSGMNLGTSDFTAEAFVNMTQMLTTSTAGQYRGVIMAQKTNTPTATAANWAWALYAIGNTATNATGLVFEAYTSNGSQISSQNYVTSEFTMDTWHHVALSRVGGELKIFLNGNQPNTYSGSRLGNTAVITYPSNNTLQLGGINYPNFSGNMKGYLDEVRITNGYARYTANFTVTAEPFPSVLDPTPVWDVANTTITVQANTTVNKALPVTSPRNTVLTYTLVSGSLANGMSLSNGAIVGVAEDVANVTNSVFTVSAADSLAPSYKANGTITFSVQPYTDPFANNVIILMPLTGTAGTIPSDLKGHVTSKEISGGGGATNGNGVGGLISTAQSKWGGGAMYVPQKNLGLLAIGNSTTMANEQCPSGTDFCVEFWFYPNGAFNAALDGTNMLFSAYASGTGFYMNINSSGAIQWRDSSVALATSSILLTQQQWHHIAFSRSGGASNTTRIFVNGNVGATFTWSGTLGTGGSTSWVLGHYQYSPISSYGAVGYYNDFRFTRGVPRYTAAFTPPIGPIA